MNRDRPSFHDREKDTLSGKGGKKKKGGGGEGKREGVFSSSRTEES